MSTLAQHTAQLVALDDDDIRLILGALQEAHSATGPINPNHGALERLANRLQFGDEYLNALDEFARLTIERKKLLASETKRVNTRLAQLEAMLLEEYAENGVTGMRHEDSGKLVSTSRRIWARIRKADPDRREVTPEERQRACDALRAAGLGDYVRDDFSTQSLSAYFAEQAKAHDEAQRELPPAERTPLDVAALLPPECVGVIELNDKPTLSVRS